MIIDARWAGISQKLLIYWDVSAQSSLGFTDNGLNKKTHPVRNSSVCENDLLMPEVKEKWIERLLQADRKVTVTQPWYAEKHVWMHLNTSNLETAIDHNGCYSWQQRTGNWGCYSHWHCPIRQEKIEKMLHGLISLDLGCDIRMVESEFAVNNMKKCIHPVLNGSGW